MLSIQSVGTSATYLPTVKAQSSAADTAASTPGSRPSIGLSGAAPSLPGLGDVILSSAAGNGAGSAADGDENAGGGEINDGDADDMPANSPSVQTAEDGTYSVGIHA